MQKLFRPWKPQYVKRNTIIQIVMFTLTFIVLAGIWPFQNYHNHEWVKQQAFDPAKDQVTGELFDKDDKKLQTVFFTKDHIYQMKVYLDAVNFDNKDFVYFRLYDDNFSCIYSEDFGCNLIKRDGYVQPVIDMDVIPGKIYFYEIIVPEKKNFWWMYTVDIIVPTAQTSILGLAENGPLYIDGIYHDDQALIADFDYGTELKWWQIVGYDLLVIILGFALYLGILYVLDCTESYYPQMLQYAKLAITTILGIGCVVFWWFVFVKHTFSDALLDNVVYGFGSVAGALWILCRIWFFKENKKDAIRVVSSTKKPGTRAVISLTWRNAIQVISFGLLFYALSMYVNAYVEYLHTNNTRWMLILMGIVLLTISSEKTLLHVINYIWLVASGIGGIIYCLQAEVGQDRYLAKLTTAVVMIWGLVILQMLQRNKKGLWKSIRKPYFAIWVAFIICTYIYRFEKTWVFTASLPFMVILLYNLKVEEKKRLLQNLAHGILFSFWLMTFYNLMHRPYHYWIYYRYSGVFHTVACTGLYLAVVIGVAFALLQGKRKNKKGIGTAGYYELFTLIIAIQYVILSMSRTAMVSVAVDMIIVMLLSVFVYEKTFIKLCKEGIVLVLLIIACFPLAFSAQRIIPAIVNDPQYIEIEDQDREFAIHTGEALDSDKYMSIERFIEMLTGRVKSSSTDPVEESAQEKELPDSDLIASISNTYLPVSMSANEEERVQNESKSDISNGRFDIFKLYLSKVSWKGNPGTVLEGPNGESIAHAHNSFIMVFYNFGILAGVIFLLLCLWTLILAGKDFVQNGKRNGIYLVPVSLIIIFGFTGLTEWTFHPCFPTGYVFLFMIPLLMKKEKSKVQDMK